MHSTCTRKPTESHQTLPSLCVILKAIRAGVGWVWLARLGRGLIADMNEQQESSRSTSQPESSSSAVSQESQPEDSDSSITRKMLNHPGASLSE